MTMCQTLYMHHLKQSLQNCQVGITTVIADEETEAQGGYIIQSYLIGDRAEIQTQAGLPDFKVNLLNHF